MLDMNQPEIIRASIVYNPLDTSDRTDAELVFQPGKSLSVYVEDLPTDIEWAVALSGVAIPKEGLSFTFPKPGDHLVVIPVPEGGGQGNGKSILALVATVALSIFAPIAGGAMAKAVGLGASKLAISLATAAVSIAGGVLINTLIPAPEQASAEDQSYGIDGPKNTSSEGVPYPVLYGEHAFGGNFIDIYTENTTDGEGKSVQYLYARTLVSEGPIQSIGQIYLNDQPIENYEDVEIDKRLGTRDQTISPWFNETISLINQGKDITEDWQYYTTSEEVDKIRMDIVAPLGIIAVNHKGHRNPYGVECFVEYSKPGENNWQPILANAVWQAVPNNTTAPTTTLQATVTVHPLYTFLGLDTTVHARYRLRGTTDPWQNISDPVTIRSGDAVMSKVGLPLAAYEIETDAILANGNHVPHTLQLKHKAGQPIKLTGATDEPVRGSFKSELLDEGFYDVRFKRDHIRALPGVKEKVMLSDVGEIKVEPVSLPYTAWLGVKIKMTGQINSIPTLTGVGEGRVMEIYDHNGEVVDIRYSRNPADIALDAYTHMRYGGQLEKERIDFAAFAEWREFCVENGLTFDGVFYETSNIDDALKHIYIAGRAQRISSGAKLSVAIDRKTSPTMMFSDGNIKSGSMQITYLPFADRINDLEIAFNDKADKYRRRAVRVTNDFALNRGEPLKSSTIQLKGIVDQQRALREGTLRMNYNRLVKRTAVWDSPLEAVNCSVGDVVVVQHKMPGWGKGGRLLPASSVSELVLDQDVTFTPGKEYRILVHQNKKTRLSGVSILSQTGNLVTINQAIDQSWSVDRITSDLHGFDFAVLRVVDSNTLLLSKDSAQTDLSAVTDASIHEVDYIEDMIVTNPATAAGASVTTNTVSPLSNLGEVPDQYPSFIFGEVQFTKKPFRIKSITRSSDSEVNLTAVEYVEEVYSDDPQAQAHNYSSLTAAEQVRNLTLEEKLVRRGASSVSYALVRWEQPENGVYTSAIVQASINGDVYKNVGETTDTQFEFRVEKGDVVLVRVLSVVYGSGTTVEPGLATVKSITVRGVVLATDAPTGWAGSAGVRSVTLFGPEPSDVDGFSHFEVYAGIAGSAFTDATKIARTESSVVTYTVPEGSGYARYWIVEVDTDNNPSGPSNAIDIVPTAISAGEIQDGAIDNAKLSAAVANNIQTARDLADEAKTQADTANTAATTAQADHAALVDGFTRGTLYQLEVDYEVSSFAVDETLKAARQTTQSGKETVGKTGNGQFQDGWTGWVTIPGVTTDFTNKTGIETGTFFGDDSSSIASIDADLEYTQIVRAGDTSITGA